MQTLNNNSTEFSPQYGVLFIAFLPHFILTLIAMLVLYFILTSSFIATFDKEITEPFIIFLLGSICIGLSGVFYQNQIRTKVFKDSIVRSSLLNLLPWIIFVILLFFFKVEDKVVETRDYVILGCMTTWVFTVYLLTAVYLNSKKIMLFIFLCFIHGVITTVINFYFPLIG